MALNLNVLGGIGLGLQKGAEALHRQDQMAMEKERFGLQKEQFQMQKDEMARQAALRAKQDEVRKRYADRMGLLTAGNNVDLYNQIRGDYNANVNDKMTASELRQLNDSGMGFDITDAEGNTTTVGWDNDVARDAIDAMYLREMGALSDEGFTAYIQDKRDKRAAEKEARRWQAMFDLKERGVNADIDFNTARIDQMGLDRDSAERIARIRASGSRSQALAMKYKDLNDAAELLAGLSPDDPNYPIALENYNTARTSLGLSPNRLSSLIEAANGANNDEPSLSGQVLKGGLELGSGVYDSVMDWLQPTIRNFGANAPRGVYPDEDDVAP